jgi:hypothetical protein
VEIRSSHLPASRKDRDADHPAVLLRLVAEPEPGVIPVFKRLSGGDMPLMRGGGEETLLCGNCDQQLAVDVDRSMWIGRSCRD